LCFPPNTIQSFENPQTEEIPPQVGAVHRYHGSTNDDYNREMAAELAAQLLEDGVECISDDDVLENFQFWGYNPPVTLPMFRRNEVWVELTPEQVEEIMNKFNPEAASN
jgi:hypothetical protein